MCIYVYILYKVHLYGTNMCNVCTGGFIFVELPIISGRIISHPINQTIATENSSVDQSQVISSRVYNKQHTRTHFQQKMSNTGSWYCELEHGTIKCTANHFNCPNKLSQNYPKIGIHWQFDQPPHPNLGSCCEVKPSFSFYIMASCHHEILPLHEWACSLHPWSPPQFARSFKQVTHLTIAIRPTAGHTSGCQPGATWVNRAIEMEETITTWKGNTAGRPSRTKKMVSAYCILSIVSRVTSCHSHVIKSWKHISIFQRGFCPSITSLAKLAKILPPKDRKNIHPTCIQLFFQTQLTHFHLIQKKTLRIRWSKYDFGPQPTSTLLDVC